MLRNLFVLVSCVYVFLVLLGVIQFHLWGQVEVIYNSHINIWENIGNAHLSRYLLVFPVYWLADILLLEHDYVFSIVCAFLILGMVLLLTRAYEIAVKKPSNTVSLVLLLFFIGLSLLMNGRIIFALYAMSSILLLYVYWNEGIKVSMMKLMSIIVIGLWFSSVSSGTFMVVFMMLLFIFAEIITQLYFKERLLKTSLVMGGGVLMFIILFSPLCVIFLDKNLSYFGGLLPMLEHGVGTVLLVLPSDVFVLISMSFAMLFLLISVFYLNLKRSRPFFVGTVIACGGGVFGYSTLTMLFPALALFLLSFKKNKIIYE